MARTKLRSDLDQDIVLYCSSDNIQKLLHLQKIFTNNFEDLFSSGMIETKLDLLDKSIEVVFSRKVISVKIAKLFQSILKYDVFIRIYGRNGEVVLFEDFESNGDHIVTWIGIDDSDTR